MAKFPYFDGENADNENLPESLNWDNMEGGILSKMQDLDAVAEPKKDRRKLFLLLLLGGFVASVLVAVYLNITDNTINATQLANVTKQKEELQKVNTERLDNTERIINIDKTATVQNDKLHSNNDTALNNDVPSEISRTDILTENRISADYTTTTNIPTETNAHIPVNTPQQILFNSDFTQQEELTAYEKKAKKMELADLQTPSFITSIESLQLPSSLKSISLASTIPPINFDKTTKQNRADTKWSFGVYAGFTNWKPAYTGNQLAQIKSSTESGIISYGARALLNCHLNEKWQISTGLEFMQRESRLEFSGERDTFLVQSLVTDIEINAYTGEKISERVSDVTIPATIWENVQHYNKYQTWSIPVLISRNWLFHEKFQLTTGIGVRYSFVAKEIGRSLKTANLQGDAFKSEAITDGVFTYQNSLGLLGSVGVQHRLNNKLGLSLSTELNWSATDTYADKNVISKPLGMWTSVGFQFYF